MKMILMLLLSLPFLVSCVSATLALANLPEAKTGDYQKQVAMIAKTAKAKLVSSGQIEGNNIHLNRASTVLKLDFQNKIKVDQDARVLSEFVSWWDVEDAVWGFEFSLNNGDKKVYKKLDKLKKTSKVFKMADNGYGISLKDPALISVPVPMPNTNAKFPSKLKLVIKKGMPVFNPEDGLKVTQSAVKKGGLAFFPYINMAFNKQKASRSNIQGEVSLDYLVEMNGYFVLCNESKCVNAQLPKGEVISFRMPLVIPSEVTSKESHSSVQKFAQELMGDVISEFALAGFSKLHK